MNILLIVWLVITPLFFALGWFAGRIDMRVVLKQAKQLPKRLYYALEALVDNKTGMASEEIKQVIEQEPQLIDLQLSLGKIYRKRGENDLAIKLHTKLLSSQYIFSNEERDKIRLELAQDFQRAGLVDRSESLLLKLVASELYSYKALDMLLDIYQQDKNWLDAIETAKQLATSDYSYHTEVAQFNCELAQEKIIKSEYEAARQLLNTALEINRKCVRANMLLGEINYSLEEYEAAIKTWQLIEKQNYNYLPNIVNRMFEAYLKINKIKECLILVKGYLTLYPDLNLHDFLYQKLLHHESSETTIEYLRQALKIRANAKIAARLIELYMGNVASLNARNDAEQIKNLLLKYNDKLSYFNCRCCNFHSKTFFWYCPACYSWESIDPNNVEA